MDNSGYQQQPAPAVPVRPVEVPSENNKKDLIKNIIIAVLAILVIACGAVAALKIVDYNKLSDNFDTKLQSSLTEELDKQLTKIEQEYSEKYNQPHNKFNGPEDYGHVEFEYPKTWNVYVATDNSSNGGDYAAYFNPEVVPPVAKNTVYAMSFEILSDSYENVTKKYNDKKYALSSTSLTINGSSAVYYTGTLPDTEFTGVMVVIKNRDKSIVLKTYNSAYVQDFDNIIDTITFNS